MGFGFVAATEEVGAAATAVVELEVFGTKGRLRACGCTFSFALFPAGIFYIKTLEQTDREPKDKEEKAERRTHLAEGQFESPPSLLYVCIASRVFGARAS